MEEISTVIIEDELSAIYTLQGMLKEFCPEIFVVGTASNESEAIASIAKNSPDLIILDIEMPPYSNGIEIVKKMPQRDFEIIITSAYPQYAISSVNSIQPCGYLVKPYSVEHLILTIKQTVNIIRKKKRLMPAIYDQGLIVSDHRKGNIVIMYHEILYFKSENSCVMIYYNSSEKENKAFTYKSLKEIEGGVPTYFFRTHHNTIVNMSKIIRYTIEGRGGSIYLSNDIVLEISVSKMSAFQDRFNTFITNGI